MSTWSTLPAMLALLLLGAWFVAVTDRLAVSLLAGRALGNPVVDPLREAVAAWRQQSIQTEAPDLLNRRLAPALYLALAAAAIAVVPLSPGHTLAPLDAGIVLWGAVEALTVVVVFLHGWSANSLLPLIGGYRYVAVGLPVILVSMFVLIGACLPAESLSVNAVVESQRAAWNVVRQPLGLPLFLLLGLSLTFRGPMDYADSSDLSGGTAAESSGRPLLVWQFARLAMLVSFAAMASTAFLGGYLGPVLPGPVWLLIKTALLLLVLVALGHMLARMPAARMLTMLWTVLLPLAFLGLLQAGLAALW